jgi:drug/metabolite transporter (DMT)-like permease
MLSSSVGGIPISTRGRHRDGFVEPDLLDDDHVLVCSVWVGWAWSARGSIRWGLASLSRRVCWRRRSALWRGVKGELVPSGPSVRVGDLCHGFSDVVAPLVGHSTGHAATLIAVAAALAAGVSFAFASVWQQRAAASAPVEMALSPRLLLVLARRPIWLAGMGAGIASFGLQALALTFGPLTLVQPLIVTELVFVVPLGLRASGVRIRTREWIATLAVVGGIVAFLLTARPHQGNPDAPNVVWLVIGSLVLVAAGAALVGVRLPLGPRRAMCFAAAAGMLFGLQSALLRTITVRLGRDVVHTLTSWHPYALAVVGTAGVLCAQSAFQAGQVAFSLPIIDTLEPSVAILIGAVAFGERLTNTPAAIAVEMASGIAIIAGVFTLDRSPALAGLQQHPPADQPGIAGNGTLSRALLPAQSHEGHSPGR